jgi:flagellar basal-body rod protein FlgB
METEKTGLNAKLVSKMEWLSDRQRLLAQNIAHSDTANYKPKDLSPFSFNQTLQQALIAPRTTDPRHIAVGFKGNANAAIINSKERDPKLSGNEVNLESELLKVSQTGVDYIQTSTLLKKWQLMLRTAMGRQ